LRFESKLRKTEPRSPPRFSRERDVPRLEIV
jgi:hypothetical protein